MLEIWKEIEGYEGRYLVSDLGRVKSLVGNHKILKYFLSNGYKHVQLHLRRKRKNRSIHSLVAQAFLGHKQCGYEVVVDHINNIGMDNRLCNLQLVSQRVNASKDKSGYTSKHIGVSLHKRTGIWEAHIVINKKDVYLGRFTDELEASKAYQKALRNI